MWEFGDKDGKQDNGKSNESRPLPRFPLYQSHRFIIPHYFYFSSIDVFIHSLIGCYFYFSPPLPPFPWKKSPIHTFMRGIGRYVGNPPQIQPPPKS